MSEKLTDKIMRFENDVEKYIEVKFKDMPAESVMEFVAFLGDKIRSLVVDVTLDTQDKCIREFQRANKIDYRPKVRYRNIEERMNNDSRESN